MEATIVVKALDWVEEELKSRNIPMPENLVVEAGGSDKHVNSIGVNG